MSLRHPVRHTCEYDTYEKVMSHMCMSHVLRHIWKSNVTYLHESCLPVNTSFEKKTDESHHTYEWVIWRVNASDATLVYAYEWVMARICMNVLCRTYGCDTYGRVMSHICMSHVCAQMNSVTHTDVSCQTYERDTYENVTSHICMSHVCTWMNPVTHMDESRHTYGWVTFCIWMSHLPCEGLYRYSFLL